MLLAPSAGLSIVALAVPDASLVVELVEAVTYTWLAIFSVALVRIHARLARLPGRPGRE